MANNANPNTAKMAAAIAVTKIKGYPTFATGNNANRGGLNRVFFIIEIVRLYLSIR